MQADAVLDAHIKIDEEYPGLRKVHSTPDIYLVDDLLTPEECDSIIDRAGGKDMQVSPVAYSGWTEDAGLFARLLPIGALPQVNTMMNNGDEPLVIAATALAIWGGLSAVFWAGAYLWAEQRRKELQALRTSTSTTLDGEGLGDGALVRKAEKLLASSWREFEAPTVIRYEPGQVLAPHFDANRGAQVEDANRGGQTLATLLVYLNEVEKGGKTAFGRLGPLEVDPQKGQGLLFFPASADGEFDERVEHEGCRAEDEKWIARIWRHERRVEPPFGLKDGYK